MVIKKKFSYFKNNLFQFFKRLKHYKKGVGIASFSSSPIYITSTLSIESIFLSAGSIHGGTNIFITGNGFGPGTRLSIGAYPCIIRNSQPNLIQCQSTDSTQTPQAQRVRRSVRYIYVMWITNSIKKNIFNIISLYSIYPTTIQVQDSPQTLLVTNYGNSLTSTVTFTYDSSLTPLLNSVSPSSGSGGIITLTGFGMAGINASVVSVSIGKANCLVIYYLNFYFYLFIWIVIKIYIDLSFILKLC